MTLTATGLAVAKADATEAGLPAGWEPRPCEQEWWQTRQSRDELVELLLGLFTGRGASPTRGKARRRGLHKLLDWLKRQPGDTWQDRWLASGADTAGFDWADLPLRGLVTPRRHHVMSCPAVWRCWWPDRPSGPATRGCCGSARR
jgi:hypothetical protein